jgi:hypothetical protein
MGESVVVLEVVVVVVVVVVVEVVGTSVVQAKAPQTRRFIHYQHSCNRDLLHHKTCIP